MIRPPPRSPLFPYPTLFRSLEVHRLVAQHDSWRRRRRPAECRTAQGERVSRMIGTPTIRVETGLAPSPPRQTRRAASVVAETGDRKSTRLNSSHQIISYAVF